MHHGVTFNFGSAKECSLPSLRLLSLMTKIIAYKHFYIIVLFPLTAILQLINFTAS